MDKKKILIIIAIILSFFLLLSILLSGSGTNQEINDEDHNDEIERAPWRRETRNLGGGYDSGHESDYDYDLDFENGLSYDFDYDIEYVPDHGLDFSVDIPKEGQENIIDEIIPEIEENNLKLIQEKVDECLNSENQRYQNILNTQLNKESFFYVGDDNFEEFKKQYESDHEKRKSECYRLYFNN